MSLILEIEKRIGDFHLDVSLETKGGVTGLLGASGSGKSMTLMCVAGIVKPDRGRIILNGETFFDSERRVNLTPQQRRVGYLFQNYALFPNMTVRQNILCGLRYEKKKAERELRVNDIIDITQLNGLEARRPNQLSGGQQQRVALARILVGDPKLLVLDEPFSALDTHLRGQLQVETRKLLDRFGKDVLLVTHDRDEAYQLCGDLALIDSGRIIAHKGIKSLFADPGSERAAALTGCKNIAAARKSGERSVEVPAWGVEFSTKGPVGDDLRAIGVRAHYFGPDSTQNRFPIRVTNAIEGPFEYDVQFRYEGQNEESRDIWWLVPKERYSEEHPSWLGVSPGDIMLLYG